MRRDRRFPVVLSKDERQALQQIAVDETLSAAAVVRRLIIREARNRGFWPGINDRGGLPDSEAALSLPSREEVRST